DIEILANTFINILKGKFRDENVSYSNELKNGIIQTMSEIKKISPQLTLSNSSLNFSESVIARTFAGENYDYNQDAVIQNKWTLQSISDIFPEYILTVLEHMPDDILKDNCDTLVNISWYEHYFARATLLLSKIEYTDLSSRFWLGSNRTTDKFTAVIGALNAIKREKGVDYAFSIIKMNFEARYLGGEFELPEPLKDFDFKILLNEYWQRHEKYTDLALEWAEENVQILLDMLPLYLFITDNEINKIAIKLNELEPKICDEEERFKLWNRLCNIGFYEVGPETDNQIPNEIVKELRKVGEKFKPKSEITRLKRWFQNVNDMRNLLSMDFIENEKLILEEQKKSIEEIYELSGIEGVIDFLDDSNVHIILAVYINDEYINGEYYIFKDLNLTRADEKKILEEYLAGKKIYAAYFKNRSFYGGLEYIKSFDITDYNDEEKAKIFSVFLLNEETLKYYEKNLSDINLFWKEQNPFYSPNNDNGHTYFTVGFEKFLETKQYAKAFDLIYYSSKNFTYSDDQIYDLLVMINSENIEFNSIKYKLNEIIKRLTSNNYDKNKMAELELNLGLKFNMFRNYRYDDLKFTNMSEKLSNEPEYFVDVLKKLIKESRVIYYYPSCFIAPLTDIKKWYNKVTELMDNDSDFDDDDKRFIPRFMAQNIKNLDSDELAEIIENETDEFISSFRNALYNKIFAFGRYKSNTENFSQIADNFEEKGYIKFPKMLRDLVMDVRQMETRWQTKCY
ncbi:MAG: hypothetical protein LBM93_01880, partial [Oscillospiraceae bacterium]|nr:hypothetical protein [Oscillospiraceae bacterium]